MPQLGPLRLVSVVFDVESPALLTRVLALLSRRRVQPHPWHPVAVLVGLIVLLGDDLAQALDIDRALVEQSDLEPVAHLLGQRSLGELLPAHVPVLRGELPLACDGQPVLGHQLVVDRLDTALLTLVRTVLERAVVRQRPARLVVVVGDQNVVVRLATSTVRVGDHEGVGVRVHPLPQLVAEIVHPLHVLGAVGVELGGVEGLPIVQGLDLTVIRCRQGLGPSRELPGAARNVAGDGDASLVGQAADIALRRRRRPAGRVVSRAHRTATRSPSSSRTSRSTSTSSDTSSESVTA